MAGRRWIAGSMLVALAAVVLAGCGAGNGHAGSSSASSRPAVSGVGKTVGTAGTEGAPSGAVPGRHATSTHSSVSAQAAAQPVASAAGDAATRIVKTGSLSVSVAPGRVGAALDRMTAIAAATGGYVQSSHADGAGNQASASVTLRMPTDRFGEAVAAARRVGKVLSLSTAADDVTGKYVDLTARRTALERTRSTYLAILSRARTIGSTLAVQQRIDDVQQQIERLAGEVKVLRNQSDDATLTVDIATAGASPPKPARHSGLAAAWDRSRDGFVDGVEAIVGALGPIVLALILVGLVAVAARVGYRRVRRWPVG